MTERCKGLKSRNYIDEGKGVGGWQEKWSRETDVHVKGPEVKDKKANNRMTVKTRATGDKNVLRRDG